jgi:glycolate oxidase
VLFDSLADRPRVQAVLDGMMAVTLELGGTITGEHGVGLAKRQYLPLEHSKAVLSLEKRLRVLFDPDVLSNPGKVFLDDEIP